MLRTIYKYRRRHFILDDSILVKITYKSVRAEITTTPKTSKRQFDYVNDFLKRKGFHVETSMTSVEAFSWDVMEIQDSIKSTIEENDRLLIRYERRKCPWEEHGFQLSSKGEFMEY